MGEVGTLTKARIELEELYLGVPDESVNLTFQHLAELKPSGDAEKKKPHNIDPISSMRKSPSIDLKKGLQLQASRSSRVHQVERKSPESLGGNRHQLEAKGSVMHATKGGRRYVDGDHPSGISPKSSPRNPGFRNSAVDSSSSAYDDVSRMNVTSRSPYQEGGGRRRPGIPHSNVCTICSTHIYIFRHRCLVCGRVYCKQCVNVGMGEMTEGRKCIDCLGRRFSLRYIQKAGEIGCCAKYPSMVKQREIKWAELGPRKSGERLYDPSGVTSRARSPVRPRTPTRAHVSTGPASFVISSPYSQLSPANHPIPY